MTRAEVLRWLFRSYGADVPSWVLGAVGVDTVALPELPP